MSMGYKAGVITSCDMISCCGGAEAGLVRLQSRSSAGWCYVFIQLPVTDSMKVPL